MDNTPRGQPLTVVFDLDGVLCVQGPPEAYAAAVPYPHAVARVNAVFDAGHRVVIQTARGMRSYGGDVGLCYRELYGLTLDWLNRHGVRFHGLRFGKAGADLYVDDRGCRVESVNGEADWEANFLPALKRLEEPSGV